MYEKLVSNKLSNFFKKYGFLPAAQFAYRKGLGSTDALLTPSHHLQKYSDAGMESHFVQLDFSAAFDKVSQWSLIQIEIIGIVGIVVSICRELLSQRRQIVVVDGTYQ